MSPIVSGAKAQDFPIEHCEGVAGFLIGDIALEIRPRIKKLANLKANLCEQ
jgi:hypothetical protein